MSTKIKRNDDGTITVPVQNGAGTFEPVTLREPTMLELSQINDWILAANAALPPLLPVTVASSREQMEEAQIRSDERRKAVYSMDGPHGAVFVKIVGVLSTKEGLTAEQLPGWALSPRACQILLDHFTDPLGGAEAE